MASMSLLTLRRPTALTNVTQSIPIPKNALPQIKLPIWETLPLDQKLPILKIPKDMMVFSKGKVGQELYKSRLQNGYKPQFISRPGTPQPYDSLYDPHLRDHLRRAPRTRSAQCTLKEFNEHRQRLAEIRAQEIHQKLAIEDALAREALLLKKVNNETEKNRDKYIREKNCQEIFARIIQEQKEIALEKKRRCQQRRNNIELRVIRVQQMRETQKRENAEKFRIREENFKKRVEASREIENMNKVKKLKKMRIHEIKTAKAIKQKMAEEMKKAKEEEVAAWEERCRRQTQQIAHNAEILRAYQSEANMRVALADRARQRGLRAEKRRLRKIREQVGPLNYWNTGNQRQTELTHAIIKLWKSVKTHTLSPMEFTDLESSISHDLIQEVVNSALLDNRDMLSVMKLAGQRLEKWRCVPMPVLIYMNNILNSTVTISTNNTVAHMLQSLLDATIMKIKTLMGIWRHISRVPQYLARNIQQQMIRKESAHLSIKLTRSERSVNFGVVRRHEVTNDSTQELRSAKFRPPTPRPSFDCLANALLCDKDEDLEVKSVADDFPVKSEMDESLHNIREILRQKIDLLINVCIENDTLFLPAKKENPMDHLKIIHRITTAVCNSNLSKLKESLEIFHITAYLIASDALQAISLHMKHHPSPERVPVKKVKGRRIKKKSSKPSEKLSTHSNEKLI